MEIPNFLNLPRYTITAFEETDDAYHVAAKIPERPATCPHCAHGGFVGFGHREQWIRDLPMHGKRVRLYLRTRRFRCKSCHRTFYETLPDVNDKRLMTQRLVAWMGPQAMRRPFVQVAEEVGVDEATVRDVFSDYVAQWEAHRHVETPTWLGLDEIHLTKPRGVVTNVRERTLVDILVDRRKDTVSRYLGRLPDRSRIQLVAMDMWRPYKESVEAVLPQAIIVIDKFHVLKMANAAVERVRKQLRQSLTPAQRRGLMHDRFVVLKREADLADREQLLLSTWTKNFPDLGEVHRRKEDFFRLFECRSHEEAHRQFRIWEAGLAGDMATAFTELTTAWHHWEREILAYFDHPITNAYTESLNSLIRATDRIGRGYSFAALRAKLLWSEGVDKATYRRAKVLRERPLADEPPTAYGGSFLRPMPTTMVLREDDAMDYGVKLDHVEARIREGISIVQGDETVKR